MGYRARAEVGEDQPAQLLDRIGGGLDSIAQGAALRFSRLLQACSPDVVQPAVIGAPEPPLFGNSVGKGRPPVGARLRKEPQP